jgi:hypothetical protein
MTGTAKAGAGNAGQGRSGAGSSQLQQHCTTIYFRGNPVMEVRGAGPLSYWRVVHGLAAVTGWQQPSLFDVEGGGVG